MLYKKREGPESHVLPRFLMQKTQEKSEKYSHDLCFCQHQEHKKKSGKSVNFFQMAAYYCIWQRKFKWSISFSFDLSSRFSDKKLNFLSKHQMKVENRKNRIFDYILFKHHKESDRGSTVDTRHYWRRQEGSQEPRSKETRLKIVFRSKTAINQRFQKS